MERMSETQTENRMRVLFVCPGYGTISRGVEVFLQELSSRMDRGRFEVTILGRVEKEVDGVRCHKMATVDRRRIEPWLGRAAVKVLRWLRLGSAAEIESFFFSLCCIGHLTRNGYDLIVPLGGYWTFLAAFLGGKGARIVSVGQAGPVKCELRLCHSFVALTDYARAQAELMAGPKNMVVIPNGVDTAVFSPGGERGGAPRVLCAAAFSPEKRYDLLFDAMMHLDSSVKLLCVGAGALPAALSAHPLCTTQRVEFRSVAHHEMPEIYRQADVFTLASPEEAFGIVFLEAMATGLNVVAADAPRQRSVVGPPGFFCDVFDAGAYAAALLQALSTPQPERNRDWACRHHWDRITRLYEEHFLSLRR